MEWIKNELFTARIDGYTAEGDGVCHTDGRAVFVPGALMDELWEIRLVKITASLAYGRGERLLEPSPARQESDCPAFPKCGGCALRHVRYEEELSMKLRRVNDALRRVGGLDFTIPEILPAEGDGFHRRKVIFNVGEANGKPVAGFYRARSHDIVPLEVCPAIPEESVSAARAVLSWMEAQGVRAYDEATHREGVRHIFYRSSALTGGIVLTLTVSRPLSKAETETLTDALRAALPLLSGIVVNLNRARGNTVLAGEFSPVWGSAELEEGLCGLRFSLSPRSFFQVNPAQAEKLYDRAMEYAAVSEDALSLDLYCGTGTLGLCMASRGARVLGAEIIEAAVKNASENAARNGLSDRCEFLCADAAEAAEEFRRRGIAPEVIVVDPPRKGLEDGVISSVAGMRPERIVYVSCDPGTLARDLRRFAELGYRVQKGACVDMFPRTSHVETVVLLSKGEIDSKRIRVEFL